MAAADLIGAGLRETVAQSRPGLSARSALSPRGTPATARRWPALKVSIIGRGSSPRGWRVAGQKARKVSLAVEIENSLNSGLAATCSATRSSISLDGPICTPRRQLRTLAQRAPNTAHHNPHLATQAATMPNSSSAGSTPPTTMSKSDFADLCNVNKSRVSNWIKEGKITAEALSGTGRSARIIVDVAQSQLRARLDPYQMMATGNGAKTKLRAQTKPEPEPEYETADYVWGHMRGVPSYAALVSMEWGASLRTAYLTYRSVALFLAANLKRSFDVEPPEPFEDIDFAFLTEEFRTALRPNDLAAWDHDFDHQWNEPEETAST